MSLQSYGSYEGYLLSDRWAGLRDQALEIAEYRCQLCNKNGSQVAGLQVHHRSYGRLGEAGELRDLVVLCAGCHKRFHGIATEAFMEPEDGIRQEVRKAVGCPTCFVGIGEFCLRKRGGVRRANHMSRFKKWEALEVSES